MGGCWDAGGCFPFWFTCFSALFFFFTAAKKEGDKLYVLYVCSKHCGCSLSFSNFIKSISLTSAPVFQTTDRVCRMGVEGETGRLRGEGGRGRGGNNLQMKNNPFRSNAISRRADGQTELQICQSAPLLLKQRRRRVEHGRRGESGEGWRDHSKGRGSGWGRSQDIRMMQEAEVWGVEGVDFLQRYSWSGSQ